MLKPMPTMVSPIRRYLNLPFSAAIEIAQHANRRVITSKLSQVLFLLTATKIGVVARNNAERRPGVVPKDLLTILYITQTDITPASASGRRILQPLNPKILAEIAWSQKPRGGLSILTKLDGSKDTKKKFFKLIVILFTPAA